MQAIQSFQNVPENDPVKIRTTEFYKQEYSQGVASKWDELIDWERRQASEGTFFIEKLRKIGAKDVLDVSTGTGFHSISLLKAGFRVVSVDGNPNMLAQAAKNADKMGCTLTTVNVDWRLLSTKISEQFDAVVCLGNSFTHLFSEHDRRVALAEFHSMLRDKGVLVIDQRNYDFMLDKGFKSKHKYYYCGKNVVAEPIHIDDGLTRFRYRFADNSEFFLNMFPIRKGYLKQLLFETGFESIRTYGDFNRYYDENDCDFYAHIAEKKYQH